ncbi:MAG: hypothetical protein LBT96_01025 [Campylobacteraceae bacterium]|nr:hypothetical protein [Campylobacteraceae bacterium]
MLSFQTSLAKLAKGRFVFSWLISLFIIFGLSGCGSTDSSSALGSDTVSAKTVIYNFYDENLDFLGSASSEEIDLTKEIWYAANSDEPYKETYEGNDEVVRLYAAKNVKEVKTQEDLENIASDLSGNYILLNDITLEGEWTPIGDENEPFSGILNSDTSDGERYAIKALKITLPNIPGISDIGAGLFEAIQDAIIKNIGVQIANLIGDINVGGIAGKAIFSTITNSYVVGNISGNGYIGGIVGSAERNSTISNSFANVSINANSDVGGLVGYIDSSVITNSYATGSVSGSFNVGGIAGSISSGIIASAYAANVIEGDDDVGGIVGKETGSLFSSTLNATLVINPSIISDELKNFIGDRTIGYIADTTQKIFNEPHRNSIEAFFGNMLSSISNFLTKTYNKFWDFAVDKIIVSHLKDEYTYRVNLGWKFGDNDANPWVTPEGGGTPILYWQAGK